MSSRPRIDLAVTAFKSKQVLGKGSARAKSLTRGPAKTAARSAPRHEGRQVTRQWLIKEMLASSRHGLTARQIHERLEEPCEGRTVFRDLARLEALGHARRAGDGKWVVVRAAGSTEGVPVTQVEAIALLVAEQRMAPLGDAWLGGAMKGLRAKIFATMNDVGRQFCADAARMILANPRASVEYADRAEMLTLLETACHEEQRVRLRHRSRGAAARVRTIEPRRLLFRDGALYVIARDTEDGQHKKFALHRIEQLEVLDESFTPDPVFDPDRYADASFGLFHGRPVHAVLEFDHQVSHLFQERQFHPSQRVEHVAAGIRVELDVAGTTDLVRWLAAFSGHVRVIEPTELRDELREHHQRGIAE